FATAIFRRVRTYGFVATEPLEAGRVRVRVFAMKRRSKTLAGRLLYDRFGAAVRRRFLANFLSADAERLVGVRYNPHRLIEADKNLADYFDWLARVTGGRENVSPADMKYSSETPAPILLHDTSSSP